MAVVISSFVLAGCVPPQSAQAPVHESLSITSADGVVKVDARIADTPELQEQGLMGVTHLEAHEGMLFVFADEQIRRFWMKDTPLPLSIAFAAANGTIVDIQDLQPFNESIVASRAPAQYALEMNQGFFIEHGITIGSVLLRE